VGLPRARDLLMPQTGPRAIEAIVDVVKELLEADITIQDEGGIRRLQPSDIAVGVTHRDQREPRPHRAPEHPTRMDSPSIEVIVQQPPTSSKAVSSRSSSSGTRSPAAETPASSISTPVGYVCS